MADGSGVVPLMAMIRARAAAGSTVPARLVYSVRTPADVIYAPELSERTVASQLDVTCLCTRAAPTGTPAGHIAELIAKAAWPAADKPAIFVCGPSGFVETAAGLLVEAGHDPASIRTERFGPTGRDQSQARTRGTARRAGHRKPHRGNHREPR